MFGEMCSSGDTDVNRDRDARDEIAPSGSTISAPRATFEHENREIVQPARLNGMATILLEKELSQPRRVT